MQNTQSIELRLLLKAIRVRYGYDFSGYTEASLQRRLVRAMRRADIPTVSQLQHRILREPALFGAFLNDLTVQVSEMFRDPSLYRLLRERVIPFLRPYPQVKIWNAGCAAGEEAYSSAILLAEEGLVDRSQIYATDLSSTALQRAEQAVFSSEQLPLFRDNYQASGGRHDFSRYYSQAYEKFALSESLKTRLFFFQHDLISDYSFGEMQMVFCRNVMIYFNRALRTKVLDKLRGALCHGGFLVLGKGERLPDSFLREYFEEFSPHDRIYRYWGTSG